MERCDLLFLGDSLTAFHDWRRFGVHCNAGVPGDTTEGILYRLTPLLEKQPKTLLLMIGINDLLHSIPSKQIKANYQLIVESVETVPRLILISLLPITRFADAQTLNAQILLINSYLKELSHQYNREYLDLAASFKDKNGDLKAEYTTDGVHLSAVGSREWEEKLTPYLL